MLNSPYTGLVAALLLVLIWRSPVATGDNAQFIEEVIVRGSLRGEALHRVAGSVSVLSAAVVRDRVAQHIDQLLNVAPNVNVAAGASRGRFVQIRGVGERSQFVDPLDPSIGLLVDGIDLSGVGNAATLFDIAQVEVLRGPQGTRYGASAMGGLLVLNSNAPTEEFEGYLEGIVGDYSTYALGAVLSGPLANGLSGRLALHHYSSDGYIRNRHLGIDDSNDFDEHTMRTRLRWQASENVQLDLAWLHLDSNNGYDAFSLDNTRSTLSDQPGRDRQETNALALSAQWDLNDDLRLQAILSTEHSDLEYGYDEDWSYVGLCAGTPCEGSEYSSSDRYVRDREMIGLDLRLSGGNGAINKLSWSTGLHAYQRDVDLRRDFFDFDAFAEAAFDSAYDTERLAVYGDVEKDIGPRFNLGAGLRLEQVKGDYSDSRAISADPKDSHWGGQLRARYALDDSAMLYVLVSRGFKASGVNGDALGKAEQGGFDPAIIEFLRERLEFDDESMVNYEAGLKGRYLDEDLSLRIAVFYMDREDMQVRAWHSEGPAFVGYLDNATGGRSRGLEVETQYRFNSTWRLDAGLGLLDSDLGAFIANDVDQGFVDKRGRGHAHAPSYQFSLAASLSLPGGVYGRLEFEGRDEFYFSNSHDARSDSYALWHLTAGYRWKQLDVALWGRNLTDEDFAVRGFRFGNDPRVFYANETFIQFGAPRTLGVTARYGF